MRLLALILLVGVAQAQGLTTLAPGAKSASAKAPLITPDENTVAHIWFPKGVLTDTKSNTWNMAGTVPVTKSALFKTPRYGAGPYTTSNYFQAGAAPDVLDFAGDFTLCIVSVPASLSAAMELVGNVSAAGLGFVIGTAITTGRHGLTAGNGTTPTYATATTGNAVAGAVSIVCTGVAGTNQYVVANGQTLALRHQQPTLHQLQPPLASVAGLSGQPYPMP